MPSAVAVPCTGKKQKHACRVRLGVTRPSGNRCAGRQGGVLTTTLYRVFAIRKTLLWSDSQRFPQLQNSVEIGSFIRVTRRRTIIGLDHLILPQGASRQRRWCGWTRFHDVIILCVLTNFSRGCHSPFIHFNGIIMFVQSQPNHATWCWGYSSFSCLQKWHNRLHWFHK